jgi:hypothetical protein
MIKERDLERKISIIQRGRHIHMGSYYFTHVLLQKLQYHDDTYQQGELTFGQRLRERT